MNALWRLVGFVLLVLLAPWVVLWAVLGLPLGIVFGREGLEASMWLAFWPIDNWVRPLLLR